MWVISLENSPAQKSRFYIHQKKKKIKGIIEDKLIYWHNYDQLFYIGYHTLWFEIYQFSKKKISDLIYLIVFFPNPY